MNNLFDLQILDVELKENYVNVIPIRKENIMQKKWNLRFTIELDKGTATALTWADSVYTILKFIESVELQVNGRNVIRRRSGEEIFDINFYDTLQDNELIYSTDTTTGWNNGKQYFELTYTFERPEGFLAFLTRFKSTDYDPVSLIIRTRKISDVIAGTGGDITFVSGNLTVKADQSREAIDKVYAIFQELRFEKRWNSATKELTINLDGVSDLDRIVITAFDIDTGDYIRTNSIINNVKIYADKEERKDFKFNDQRQDNAKFYMLKQADLKEGVVIIDFDRERQGMFFNTMFYDTFKIVFDVNTPTDEGMISCICENIGSLNDSNAVEMLIESQ